MRALATYSAAAAFAGLLTAAAMASCVSTTGELIVVVQTDMALPMSIDAIRIQASVLGVVKYERTFEDLGTSDAPIKLPATLALKAPEDASSPVRVRVIGLRGGQDGEPRVLREVVTTVPVDRVATLQIQLQSLCVGFVFQEGGDAKSTCPHGETCRAGTCESSKVDESDLPDFANIDVFGGGTGKGDGACFDVLKCFEGAHPLKPVNKDTCTFGGLGDGVNVALLMENTGICSEASCFVALDAEDASGWTKSGPDEVTVPQAVCNPTGPTKAIGVVAAPLHGGCLQKTVKLPTCGPWSSAGSGGVAPSQPKLSRVASSQAHPVSLAVEDGHVYWINLGVPAAEGIQEIAGSVNRAGDTGGGLDAPPVVLKSPRDLALSSDAVFFTDAASGAMGKGALGRLPFESSTGSTPEATELSVTTSSPEGIAVSGDTVLWTEFSTGMVRSLKIQDGGQSGTATVLASDQGHPFRIATDGKTACWTNEGTFGGSKGWVSCKSVTATGNEQPPKIGGELITPRAIAMGSDGRVYWTTFTKPGEIGCATPDGNVSSECKSLTLVGDYPNGIAVDGTDIYWTSFSEGTVKKVPLSAINDEKVTVLASGQDRPSAIKVTDEAIYWINEGDPGKPTGSVMRLAK